MSISNIDSECTVVSKRLFDKLNTAVSLKMTINDKVYLLETNIASYSWNGRFDKYDLNIVLGSISKPKFGNYFDVRGGIVSFNPKEPAYTDNNKWVREGRLTCKPSKLIKHILDNSDVYYSPVCMCESGRDNFYSHIREVKEKNFIGKVNNLIIEQYSNLLKVNEFNDVLVSDDIVKIYSMRNSSSVDIGTLSESCMRPTSNYTCHNYVDFYDLFENAQIVYIKETGQGRLVARAVLWHKCVDTDTGEEFSFVDRIYGSGSSQETIKQWAHENGYAHKKRQTYSDSSLVMPSGKRIGRFFHEQKIDGDLTDHVDGLPYLDTLYFLQIKDDHIQLHSFDSTSIYDYEMQDSDGICLNGSRDYCTDCGAEIDVEYETVYYVEGLLYCHECAVYVERDDMCYRGCDVVYVNDINEYVWLHDDDLVSVYVPAGTSLSGGGTANHSGDMYFLIGRSPNIAYCDYSDEHYLNDDVHHYDDLGMNVADCHVEDAYLDEGYVYDVEQCKWVTEEEYEQNKVENHERNE